MERSAITPARAAAPRAAPPQLFGTSVPRVKAGLFALGLVPLGRWIWLGATGGLTANPVEFLTRSSGTWTLVCLLVTLAVTPLRTLLGQPALLQVRRMCGLFTFFYAALHFMSYVWWDQWFDPVSIAHDIAKRPFITVGFAAFAGLAVLAATSTRGWMRRLGRRWQALHRLVYVIAVCALAHYWWQKAGKNDFAPVLGYAAVFAGLMAYRLLRGRRTRAAGRA